MIFNSFIFILMFLPVALIGYFLLGRLNTVKNTKPPVYDWWLVFVSIIFYSYASCWMSLTLIASVAINAILNNQIGKRKSKSLTIVSIVLNVLFLVVFKYLPIEGIIAPLGISFITFSQIAYAVDSYKGKCKEDSLCEYLMYILWFPKLIEGPLLKHDNFMKELRNEERLIPDYENLSKGVVFFAIGLGKKMFIADKIAMVVDYGYSTTDGLGFFTSLLMILGYTLQIYMDFSGYCDMAYGISLMFNITLPQNFNSPYKSDSITDFWKRWHISLTDFLREYIYFPLGGSKKGNIRTCVNIIIVFLISGIWHGNNITFVLWGLLHGVLQVIERIFQKGISKINRYVRCVLTFVFVNIGWLLFRAPDLKSFCTVFWGLFKKGNVYLNEIMFSEVSLPVEDILRGPLRVLSSYSSWLVLITGLLLCFIPKNIYETKIRKNVISYIAVTILLLIEILNLSGAYTSFIYFDF